MSEFRKVLGDFSGHLRRPKILAATAFIGLALAGCEGDKISADSEPVQDCGDRAYNKAIGKVRLPSDLLDQARQNVLELQKRTLKEDGDQIALASTIGEINGITADSDNLTIKFVRDKIHTVYLDYVKFPIEGKTASVSLGSIACREAGGLHPNGTFNALETYMQGTAPVAK